MSDAHPPRPAPAGDKARRAASFCEELLRRLGGEVAVEARETAEAIGIALAPAAGNRLELTSALLEAVQVLATRVANPQGDARKPVNLDVGGFREDADPAVKAMAERLAAAARRTNQVLAIAPISARERRQIHLALVEAEGVSTRSEGEGLFRTLLIVPGKPPPPAKG